MFTRERLLALFIILILSSTAAAQHLIHSEPVRLTKTETHINFLPRLAWNGEQYGVVFANVLGKAANIHFLTCDKEGNVIIKERELHTYKTTAVPYPHGIVANRNGWAYTYEIQNRALDKAYYYFQVLNEFGIKKGGPTLIYDGPGDFRAYPYYFDSFYLVFYSKGPSENSGNIFMAKLDANGQRMQDDIQITQQSDGRLHPLSLEVVDDGLILLGYRHKDNDIEDSFFIKLDLAGNVIQNRKVFKAAVYSDAIYNEMIWNGQNLALNGMRYNTTGRVAPYKLIGRIIQKNGQYVTDEKILASAGSGDEVFMGGLCFNGSKYCYSYFSYINGSFRYKTYDHNLFPLKSEQIIDARYQFPSDSISDGNQHAFFMGLTHPPNENRCGNLYFNALDMRVSGKPQVIYFQGFTSEMDGKTYAVILWHFNGADTLKLKAKGLRRTVPARGYLAYEISKRTRFKLIGENDSGKVKGKLKINIP